jgi:hypothetical protein
MLVSRWPSFFSSSKTKGDTCKGKIPAPGRFDDDDDLDDDNHFMPSDWAKKSSSTKGKSVAEP